MTDRQHYPHCPVASNQADEEACVCPDSNLLALGGAVGGLFESLDAWADAKAAQGFYRMGLDLMARHSVNRPADLPERARDALLDHWYGLPADVQERITAHLGARPVAEEQQP